MKEKDAKRNLHRGTEDALVPLQPLDPTKIDSVDELVRAMAKTAFTGREIGRAADIIEKMAADADCTAVLTLSGAMTVAKQGLLICELIERDIVQAIVSTGALMAHGLVEGLGLQHFKVPRDVSDETLYQEGYNRVYDTLEPEHNLNEAERIMVAVLDKWNPNDTLCSWKLCNAIGEYLYREQIGGPDSRAILKSAYRRGCPIYVPAFSDSELGLDFALFNKLRVSRGDRRIDYDPFDDMEHFVQTMTARPRMGIVTVGGGVPRNWAQQIGPYVDLLRTRYGSKIEARRYTYGVRICPEPVHWGGLSGCTYSEGVSWGKFVPASEGGMTAEVLLDATVGLPLIVTAVLERL